jgi:hypothetical protein
MASVELHQLQDMQALEEEKSKLEGFCEKGLKNVRWHKISFHQIKIKILIFYQAMTQERRRYGFILERQCVLAKHVLSYHSLGSAALQRNMDDWKDVARSRDILPDNVQLAFANKLQVTSLILFWTKFNAKYSIDIFSKWHIGQKRKFTPCPGRQFPQKTWTTAARWCLACTRPRVWTRSASKRVAR